MVDTFRLPHKPVEGFNNLYQFAYKDWVSVSPYWRTYAVLSDGFLHWEATDYREMLDFVEVTFIKTPFTHTALHTLTFQYRISTGEIW